MISVPPGDRDTLVTFERPIASKGFRGAGAGTWESVGDEWVELRDMLPSRGEQPASGMPVALRRARVRMDYRDDITPDMRIVEGEHVLQIVSGPVTLGRRAGLEMVVEEVSPAGNAA
ncbi:head-tail adaptor protein [uncultured Sphingomonas sp.]|uniref:head-tail adaptor protein n=1 Tax=uncultured Sphingomonas sp. TaxID=158754 RepID=UPI0025E01689|nr:head-tail adaptor protein [uncultured Sphingomonas sp.]